MADDDTQRLVVNIEARLANYEKQLARANRVTQDALRGVADTVDRRMREAERRAEQAGARINSTLRQSFSGLKGSLLAGGSNAASLLGLGAITAGFGVLGAEIVDTMGRAQNLNTRLRTLLGSEGEAAKAQEYLAETAQKLSVDYFALGDSYARLLPIVNSGILSTGDARKILEGFSNVAAATGASTEQLGQSLFGLSQGLSAGTLRAEELNQITEPLPGIMQALDRAFVKVTGSTDAVAGSFRRAVNDGEVTSGLLRTTLVTALGEYDGAASEMSGNVTASLTRLRNEWSLVVTEMSKSLADPFTDVISGASRLVGLLGDVAKNYNALPDSMKKGNIAFGAGVAFGEVTAGLPAGTTANEIRDQARAEAQQIENTIKERIARREELSRLPVAPDGQPVNDEAARELGAINDELNDLNRRLPEVRKKYEEFDTQQRSLADGVRELRREQERDGQPFPPTIPDRPSTAAGLPPLPKKGSLEYESTFGDAGGVIDETKASKAKKAKEESTAKLAEHIRMLQVEADRLSLSGVALKENELLTEAAAQAKEDFKNKLRTSADLTDAETASIKANAKVLAGVPDILSIARDKLPEFDVASQVKQLTELQGLLADPAVVEALAAQGLSAEEAGKAIQAQILAVKDQANGTADAIQGIGEAFQSGIQGAQSFEDAVLKIGIALGQMLLQAALFGKTQGGGPLGGVFDSIFGTIGGLLGGLGSSSSGGLNLSGPVPSQSTLPKLAGGGPLGAGQAAIINELGQEAANRGGDLFIPGKATRIIPADATRRMAASPANSNGQPINFTINMAGANGDRTIGMIAEAAVKRGLAQVPEINRQHRIRFSQ